MMTRLSRIAFALLLAMTLATTTVSAAPATARPSRIVVSSPMDFFEQIWSVVRSFWAKNGCEVDPNGRCLPVGGTTVTTDNGCSADPSGRCLPQGLTMTPENGCQVDPDGRCVK